MTIVCFRKKHLKMVSNNGVPLGHLPAPGALIRENTVYQYLKVTKIFVQINIDRFEGWHVLSITKWIFIIINQIKRERLHVKGLAIIVFYMFWSGRCSLSILWSHRINICTQKLYGNYHKSHHQYPRGYHYKHYIHPNLRQFRRKTNLTNHRPVKIFGKSRRATLKPYNVTLFDSYYVSKDQTIFLHTEPFCHTIAQEWI